MAELKRGFSSGKMNKDLDERLVQNGDFRDALNIQVSSSDTSDMGSVQNLLGNTELTGAYFPDGCRCVGVVTDGENDDIYWFVAGPNNGYAVGTMTVYTDWIVRYNVHTGAFTYVFVDHYRVDAQVLAITTQDNADDTFEIHSAAYVKEGSTLTEGFFNTFVQNTYASGTTDYQVYNGVNQTIQIPISSTGQVVVGDILRINQSATATVLGFHRINTKGLITGINIIDDMLFWTDNFDEPKKININRSIIGTGGNLKTNEGIGEHDKFPTRVVTKDDAGRPIVLAKNQAQTRIYYANDFNITVIRPNPTTPPVLKMSETAAVRETSAGVANSITETVSTSALFQDDDGDGTFEPNTGVITLTFDAAVDYRPGDVIFMTLDLGASVTSFTDDINDTANFVDDVCRVQILPNPNSQDGLYNDFPDTLQAGAFTCQILSVSSNVPAQAAAQQFLTRLAQEDPLFEFKFPRFAYRYKYVDGEYSAISPFSEIAFIPGEFDYFPQKGHNLSMVNRLRSLKIRDYVMDPAFRPVDVVEVDILYKEDSSPTVYTVKTLRPFDPVNTSDPIWPSGYNASKPWGEFTLTSELIHAALPANQMLRPYDNVPRKALAQEVTANRLVYGNYLQNYNLKGLDNKLIKPKISLGLEANPAAPLGPNGLPMPSKSIKSLRTYQIGVVYGDRFGRETPVLADKKQGSIYVDKAFSCSANQLKARILSNHPNWAKYFKFFLKETSNEYYNMAMDRWYDAEDGNIWMSFASSDRNKVDIDTYLILKKAHDSDKCIQDKARYSILAIENEAPLYIKLNKRSNGVMSNDSSATFLGNSAEGFPFEDYGYVILNGAAADTAFGDMSQITAQGNVAITFYTTNNSTKLYDVSSIQQLNNGDYKIIIDGYFESDVLFLAPAGTWASRIAGIQVELITKVYEDKPEFDGRFFVKIYKDQVLEDNVLNVSVNSNLVVQRALGVGFLHTYGDGSNSNTLPDVVGGVSTELADSSHLEHPTQVYEDPNGGVGSVPDGVVYEWGHYGGLTGTVGEFNFEPGWINYNHNLDVNDLDNQGMGTGNGGGGGDFWYDWYTHKGYVTQIFIDSAWAYEYNCDHGSGSTRWNNFTQWTPNSSNNVQTNQAISSAWGTGSALHGNGTFRNKGWGITDDVMDLSVVAWSNEFDWSANDYKDIANVQQNFYTADFTTTDTGRTENIRSFLNQLRVAGTQWRFKDDPAKVVYTTVDDFVHYGISNVEQAGLNQYRYFWGANMRTKTSIQFTPSISGNWNPCENMRHDGSQDTVIEILTTASAAAGDLTFLSDNPAIWETEPKEAVDVDIYYEMSHAYPVELMTDSGGLTPINVRSNEEAWARQNTLIELIQGAAGSVMPANNRFVTWGGATPSVIHPLQMNLTISAAATLAVGDILGITTPHGDTVTLEVTAPVVASTTVPVASLTHNNEIKLGWFNCYSYGNGVESNRIRDDFGQSIIAKGVKASSTIAEPYEEERRGSGLIHSGIYNSVSGVNNLNQFIQAEPITKDLNPDYGTIQKLKTRNTDLLTLCEDKCLSVLANKDALFNADGSQNVASSKNVLGTATPIAGDYGISQNPESFAADSDTYYFTDRQRNAVINITGNTTMPISDLGMKDYFTDLYKTFGERYRLIGSFDDKKDEYNISFQQYDDSKQQVLQVQPTQTITYSVKSKGWVSFKSFAPEAGISINNEYYTYNDGDMWKHHDNSIRNNFYGSQYLSHVEVIFNDNPGAVKSFGCLNYEGTQSHIDQFTTVNQGGVNYTDQEYYNLVDKLGWYVESIVTDLQSGKAYNFRNKEGKWFACLCGDDNFAYKNLPTYLGSETYHEFTSAGSRTAPYLLDTEEFTVQGIGMATLDSDESAETSNIEIKTSVWFANTQDELIEYPGFSIQAPYDLQGENDSVNTFTNSDRWTEWDKSDINVNEIPAPGGVYSTSMKHTSTLHTIKTHSPIAAGNTVTYNTAGTVEGSTLQYLLVEPGAYYEARDLKIGGATEIGEDSNIWNTNNANVSHGISQVEFYNVWQLSDEKHEELGTLTAFRPNHADYNLTISGITYTYIIAVKCYYNPLAQSQVYNVQPATNEYGVHETHWIDVDFKED